MGLHRRGTELGIEQASDHADEWADVEGNLGRYKAVYVLVRDKRHKRALCIVRDCRVPVHVISRV